MDQLNSDSDTGPDDDAYIGEMMAKAERVGLVDEVLREFFKLLAEDEPIGQACQKALAEFGIR